MQKKYFFMLILSCTTHRIFCAGSAPEASLEDGVKHKVNVYGTLTLHTNPTMPIPVEHITINRQIEKIPMYIKPERGDGAETNYVVKTPDEAKKQKKVYELNINPTQAYEKIDLVSKDSQGEIRIETVEIVAPEPDALWVYKNGARKYEYIEVVVTANLSGHKRYYLIERSKEVICDEKETAGQLRGAAKIAAVKSLKIEGFKVENGDQNCNGEKTRPKRMKTAKSRSQKNHSMRIIKSS